MWMKVGAVVFAGALLTACSTNTEAPSGSEAPESVEPVSITFDPETKTLVPDVPVDEWCGDQPAKLGITDGVPFNAWRQIAFAIIEKEAAKCPAIDSEVLYVTAGGDQQKAVSDINALVAQGVTLIQGWMDFGEAQLPAIKAATAAGVTVVPYGASVGGKPGVDYAATTLIDNFAAGEALAKNVAEYLDGKGNIFVIGGIPGAPSSQALFDGVKEGLKDFPDITILVDNYVVTNWSPVDAQKATTGLISKFPEVDAVLADYGATTVGVVNAFQAAGKPIPAIGVVGVGNELGCVWEKNSTTDDRFELFSQDSAHGTVLAGVQQGIGAATGGFYNVLQHYVPPAVNNTPAGTNPKCDASLPVDTDFTSPLTDEELVAVLTEQ
jgi:ribose transport system substrate-binding protein